MVRISSSNCFTRFFLSFWDGESFDGMPVGCPIATKKIRKLLPRPFKHPTDTVLRRVGNVKNTPHDIRCNRAMKNWIRIPRVQTHQIVRGYQLFGYFCSWNCARAYGMQNFPMVADKIGSHIYSILLLMTDRMKADGELDEGYHVKPPKSAPHFSMLKSYNGILTIEEFRTINERDNNSDLTCIPSWIPIIPAGMRVSESPLIQDTFSRRYNTDQANKMLNRRLYRPQAKRQRIPIVAQANKMADVPNSILFCLNSGKEK